MTTEDKQELLVLLRKEETSNSDVWQVVERPGYQGKRKEEDLKRWNKTYGEGNWRLAWELKSGRVMSFEEVFTQIYIRGYKDYFANHPEEAVWIAENFSFAYDKDIIAQEQAFDLYALYNIPGKENQFHHVALNIALKNLGYQFKGEIPLKVREAKPGIPQSEWPVGWRWSPGRIPLPNEFEDEVAEVLSDEKVWWQPKTVEDFYQRNKVLQVKKT